MHLGSLTFQVKKCFDRLKNFGVSRDHLKRVYADWEMVPYITSITTHRAYIQDGNLFASYTHDMRGIRNIHNLERDMGVEYIHYLLDAGYAGGTVGRRRCAIRKMSFSLFGEFWPLPSVPHSPPRPEKVYAPGEVETLLNDMYGRTRHACVPDVVRFQFVTAARIREAVWVQTEDIEPQSGLVRLDKGTKGGRPRLIQVDPEHRPFLRDLKNKAIANADGYVFQKRNPLPGRVYSAVRYACKRTGIVCQGTHGFRKRAARDRLARCLNQGMSEAEAYQALALHLGHYRTSILVHYLPDYKE